MPWWPLEGDKLIAHLIAVDPGPKAQFAVKAYPGFAGAWEGKVPASKRLIMLLTDEIRSDVHVVYELKDSVSPEALHVLRIRINSMKAHEATNNGQIGMLLELFKRTIKPASFVRYDVIVLDKADDLCRSKPDCSIENSNFMEVIWENEKVIWLNQMWEPLFPGIIQWPIITDN
jgi:hypothetical protein